MGSTSAGSPLAVGQLCRGLGGRGASFQPQPRPRASRRLSTVPVPARRREPCGSPARSLTHSAGPPGLAQHLQRGSAGAGAGT